MAKLIDELDIPPVSVDTVGMARKLSSFFTSGGAAHWNRALFYLTEGGSFGNCTIQELMDALAIVEKTEVTLKDLRDRKKENYENKY